MGEQGKEAVELMLTGRSMLCFEKEYYRLSEREIFDSTVDFVYDADG